jgi:hypothetical protein
MMQSGHSATGLHGSNKWFLSSGLAQAVCRMRLYVTTYPAAQMLFALCKSLFPPSPSIHGSATSA